MHQADKTDSNGPPVPATGKASEISRRALFGAAACLALAPAAAASLPEATVAGVPRSGVDAAFWRARDEYKALDAAWEADPDDSEENWNRWSGKVEAAFEAMLMIPVHSVKAVLAKYSDTGGHSRALPYPANDTLQMIRWDLERIAVREMTT